MMMLLLLVTTLLAAVAAKSRMTLKDSPTVGGICDPTVKSMSGYAALTTGVDKNYFYWFFESRDAPIKDPFIMWLTGGPGCSSQLALMTENGPWQVNIASPCPAF